MFISDTATVGEFGAIVSSSLKDYIGYIAYITMPFFLFLVYRINTKTIEDILIKTMFLIFIFISLIVLQALIIKGDMEGSLGVLITQSLFPFIGTAGLWVFLLICAVLAFVLFLETNDEKAIFNIKPSIQKILNIFKIGYPKINIKKLPKKVDRSSQKIDSLHVEQKLIVKEVGDTAEILYEEDIKPSIVESNEKEIEEVVSSTEPIIQKKEEVIINKEEKPEVKELVQDIKEDEVFIEPLEEDFPHSVIVEELEENKKLLEEIEVGDVEIPKDFQLPPTNIFQKAPKEAKSKINEAFIDQKMKDLIDKLKMFKIEGDVVRTYTGPIVTTFEFKPAPNVKVSKILNLQDDLAMALKAQTIRIQAPIPGKDVVGIEVPNDKTDTIYIREILESEIFSKAASPLTMILGKDIVGQPFVTDLKKLPHLLIAGTTGSGKSVGLNSMILSLLYKNSPDNLKLIMIDPKMIEFSIYNDIPHLLTPVITKPTEAINALANMVGEMERRYALMAETRTKNIETYNEKVDITGHQPFPYIVIIIDELADLMMTSGKEVEISIARIAQKARACGIHLIVATQRPSVDVVTGLIKANLPSRISYKVGQKVDSKIILDAMGAESLLGRGDMLFTPPGVSGLVRIHAPWSDEKEIEEVVEFLKEQKEATYDISFLKESGSSSSDSGTSSSDIGELDELYEQAKLVVIQDKKSSISYLQRRLKIGYNRSATIIEQLEMTGVLSEANAKGNREILI
ncbi:MAG: DNA translocase FtsK 4TM domain-containing protein [Campylobacterota bacterium]|nr:DNA translocase FtsK 4TM domain-containing protein [Campylobacterota bacterium]